MSGCSTGKLVSNRNEFDFKEDIHSATAGLKLNNISDEDFFITKGLIFLKSLKESQRFIFNVRHKAPDIYLISIRNNMGIEGGRIYVTKDTLLINDRVNRRVLYGKPEMIRKLTGMPLTFIDLLFGDISGKRTLDENKIESKEGKVIINQLINGFSGISEIDIKMNKIRKADWNTGPGSKEIKFRYSDFDRGGKHFPHKVQINSDMDSTEILIRIEKIEFGLIEEPGFIPGENYKHEEIK